MKRLLGVVQRAVEAKERSCLTCFEFRVDRTGEVVYCRHPLTPGQQVYGMVEFTPALRGRRRQRGERCEYYRGEEE